jgi:predicted RNase H-like HicB family nuclease
VDGAFDVDILELPGVGTGAESPEAVELRSRERIGGWLEVEDAAFDVRVVHGEDIPD